MHSNMLPCIFSFIFLLLPPVFSAGLVAKPGCVDRCGNLSIPYPFGVGSDCSLEPSFNISCDTSSDPPKAYITILGTHVIEINESYVRVKYPNFLASACYNLSYHMPLNLSGTQYTLSGANWLTAIGCDDMVVGTELPTRSSSAGSTCASLCAQGNATAGIAYCPDNGNRSVIGNGCCQAFISQGTTYLKAQLTDLSGALQRHRLFPCSYAFIQEMRSANQSGFSYHLNFLQNNSKAFPEDEFRATLITAPVVQLNWRIGNKNCSQQLSNDPTYACRDRSICVDLYNTDGYLCSCFQGYKGNAYLNGGCQAFSNSIAKRGCLDQCGNLSIPFPFGVGPNCYLEPSFSIGCNFSSNPPKAYLSILKAEIIDLSPSQVRVYYPNMALACYDSSDGKRGISKTESRSFIIDMTATPFTLSDQNMLTAVGCDDMVVGYGESNRSFVGGSCAAFCTSLDDVDAHGYCASYLSDMDMYLPGVGCCQTVISRGTSYLEANLTDLSGQWRRSKLFPCSFAFITQKTEYSFGYSFPLEYLQNSTAPLLDDFFSIMLAMVLDWRIGIENCKQARRNPTTFACRGNTSCVDFEPNVGGYLCNCLKGYEGNPYLGQGCQDIDECGDDTTNPCESNSICINTPGSFLCECPKGFRGDGTKYGRGCIELPPSKSKMIILTGMGSGFGLLLLLLMCIWLYKMLRKRKEKMVKEKFFKRNGGLLLQQQTNEGALGKIKVFSAKELEIATDHFNESRILGHGGQGTVYKGMLSDGKIVAIKKSKLVEENQLELFINEVVILSQINHRNVVKLLGCCLETEVPLLVYEFMPNGTLFELIHDPNNEFLVPWNMRLKIAADIAGALAYLHSASSMPIYHRDIKSSNILLDEKYVIKVSDFGTSRSIAMDQTHLTTLVKGTFGYLDPEYFQSSQFTEKSDVYSFGVVVVELLTGQRPISFDKTEEERGLATRFLTCMEGNCLDTILDPQVWQHGRKEEVILVARLAQRCLNLKGRMRPTMKEVAIELESYRISEMSSDVKVESEDVRAFEDMPTMISDIEYTWTGSYKNASTSSSSDTHPLMFPTII
ncbi:wall-associated receptor kinase 1-like [Salvia miltiorrhiza]|uniref:wall-associated receptor kinase 1-like n=1 Tax=Salvia miltiorrhiza TaxID=226208 RepID=UPI0025AC1A6C|nr:wall-associated receptor kinase 1-like [Salvia miltiorrhiza]